MVRGRDMLKYIAGGVVAVFAVVGIYLTASRLMAVASDLAWLHDVRIATDARAKAKPPVSAPEQK